MRRTTAAVLLATALALTGAGCGKGGDKPAADAKPSTSPSPTTDPADAFMQAVIDAHLDAYTRGIPAADQLTPFPSRWCDALEAGHTVQWILDDGGLYPIGSDWGTQKADAYQLVLIGTQTHCPKWTDQVREDLRNSGEY